MAQVTLTWHGDAQAQAALAGLPDKLERRVLASALRTVAKQLLPAIKAATPIGKPYTRVTRGRTRQGPQGASRAIRFRRETGGRLRRSLKIRALKRSRRRVGVAIVTGTRVELGITGRGYYPAHQEFGFRTRGSRRAVASKRYMKHPATAHRGSLLGTLAAAIRAGVEQEIRP